MLQPEQEPQHVVTYDEETHVYTCTCGAASEKPWVPPRLGETVALTGDVRTVEMLWPLRDQKYRITLDVDGSAQ